MKPLYYKGFSGILRNNAYMSKFLIELWFYPQKWLFFSKNFIPSKSKSVNL